MVLMTLNSLFSWIDILSLNAIRHLCLANSDLGSLE